MSRIIVDIQLTLTRQYQCKYHVVLCLQSCCRTVALLFQPGIKRWSRNCGLCWQLRRERQVLLSQREEYHQSVLDKFGLQGWRTAEIPPTEIEEYPDTLSLSQVRNLRNWPITGGPRLCTTNDSRPTAVNNQSQQIDITFLAAEYEHLRLRHKKLIELLSHFKIISKDADLLAYNLYSVFCIVYLSDNMSQESL